MEDTNPRHIRLSIHKALKPHMPVKSGDMMEGKKIKGRKRHIAVDTMGNLLGIVVHRANEHDTMSGIFPALFAHTLYPSIRGFCADAGYRGNFECEIKELLQLNVDIVKREKDVDWEVLPKRWIVERTFAWLNNSRRLSKDYEITTDSAECMVKVSHIHTLLKRL